MVDRIKQAYDYMTKARNSLLAYHQERNFDKSPEEASTILTDCGGYVTESGVAVLEIGETLPHGKLELTAAVNNHWLGCIHAAVGKLAESASVPRFEKAIVGISIAMPRGVNNARIWDTSNRAINLILNNLKGIFFHDDNIEHMAFVVVGDWSDEAKTTIYVGDFAAQSCEVMRLLTISAIPAD